MSFSQKKAFITNFITANLRKKCVENGTADKQRRGLRSSSFVYFVFYKINIYFIIKLMYTLDYHINKVLLGE